VGGWVVGWLLHCTVTSRLNLQFFAFEVVGLFSV
jgi:hypothetical protein